MNINDTELVPVLDNVLSFTQAALADHVASQTLIAEMQAKLAQHDRVVLQKVAAARTEALDPKQVDKVLNDLVSMRLMSAGDREKVAATLKTNPGSSLEMITKLATMLVTPSEGRELDEQTLSVDSDPDGWGAMCEGKPVRIKR